MHVLRGVLGAVAFLSATTCVLAAAATFYVSGKVVDVDGKPVDGATVTLANQKMPDKVYDAITDAKGRYRTPPIPWDEQAKMWTVHVKKQGMGPARIRIASRKSDRTLIADIVDTKLAANAGPQEVMFAAFGFGEIDYTLQPAAEQPLAEGLISAEAAATAVEGAAADDPWAQAITLVQESKFEESVPAFEKAIEALPDDPERRELYAKVLYKLDRPGDALKQVSRAAGLAPDKVAPRMMQAELLMEQGSYDQAWMVLDRARADFPQDLKVLERAAAAAQQTHRHDEAIEIHEAILAQAPSRAESWMALGTLYGEKGEVDKSRAALAKVTELDPAGAYETFYKLVRVIENKDNLTDADNAAAVDAYRKSIEAKPDYAPAYRQLGYALLRTGDLKGARAAFEKFLSLDPKSKDAAEIRDVLPSLPK